MPKLIAKERFYYNGRNVEKDEAFDAVEQDVALLTDSVSPRARKPDDKDKDKPAKPAKPVEVESRDMKAAEASAPTAVQPMTLAESPGSQPRRYNRRDLRAKP